MKLIKWFYILISGLLLTAIGAHAYLGTFSRFIGDDFCSAYQAERLGPLRATWFWYLNWSGRYTASFLDSLAGYIGPTFTPFATILSLLLWSIGLIVAIYFWLTTIKEHKLLKAITIGLTIIFVTLVLNPEIEQSFYWGQGARSSTVSLIFIAYIAIFLSPPVQEKINNTTFSVALICGSSFVLGGFSETIASTQVAFYGIFMFLSVFQIFKISKKQSLILVSALLGSVIAILVIALSPGTAIRQSTFQAQPELFNILSIANLGFSNMLNQFLNFDNFLAIFLLLGISFMIGSSTPLINSKPSTFKNWGLLGISFLLAFIAFLPAAYATNDFLPERTQVVPIHFIAFGFIIFGFRLGQAIIDRHKLFNLVLLSLLCISFLSSTVLDLKKTTAKIEGFSTYATWWDTSHQNILNAVKNGETTITIPVMTSWTRLNVLGDNPRFWLNKCMSGYYHIQVFGPPSK